MRPHEFACGPKLLTGARRTSSFRVVYHTRDTELLYRRRSERCVPMERQREPHIDTYAVPFRVRCGAVATSPSAPVARRKHRSGPV